MLGHWKTAETIPIPSLHGPWVNGAPQMAILSRQLNFDSWVLFAIGCIAGFSGGIAFGCYLLGLEEVTLKAFDVAIKAAGVLATVMAVIVALFKDDLRRPRLQIQPVESDWVEEGAVQSISSAVIPGVNSMNYVTEYSASVKLLNVSSILAKDCQLHFVKMCKDRHDGARHLNSERILDSVPINPRSDHSVKVLELFLPPVSDQESTQPPALRIGTQVIKNPGGGTWFCTYRLTGSNIVPTDITLKVMWDGDWKHRKTEMNLKVEEVKS